MRRFPARHAIVHCVSAFIIPPTHAMQPRSIAWSAYAVAAALILFPLGDALLTLYPWNAGEARWRFGAAGVLANALLLPLAGLLIALLTAWATENRIFARVIGFLAAFAGVGWVAALILFALDALQTRAMVNPAMLASFNAAAIGGGVKGLILAAILGVIGVAGMQAGRGARRKAEGHAAGMYSIVAPGSRPVEPAD